MVDRVVTSRLGVEVDEENAERTSAESQIRKDSHPPAPLSLAGRAQS